MTDRRPGLADMFLGLVKQEARALPGLKLTQAEQDRDVDLYRRLVALDSLREKGSE